MNPVVNRPETEFEPVEHVYQVEGEDVLGVSSVAKIGGAEESFSIGSAWGFRIGYEGAYDVLDGTPYSVGGKDDLREELKKRGLTPWSKRDKAAERGTAVHDVLERLAQNTADIPSHSEIEAMPEGERGHVRSLLCWYLHYRPSFVATEVQVASRDHRFAGRYDIRARINARRLLPCIDPLRDDAQAERIREIAAGLDEGAYSALGLIDLKTSKRIYPETHFPQLEGYEGGSVEMGFPATDFRAVLNTNEDGSFDPVRDFAISWSTYDDFLAFAEALRAIRRINAASPEVKREKVRDEALIANLPARSSELVALGLPELAGMDSRSVGYALGRLRKKGRVSQVGQVWEVS